MHLGIMQGRLLSSKDGRLQSFPGSRWQEEFELAASVGLTAIEWLFDEHDAVTNPLGSAEGRRDIYRCVMISGIKVSSICAHCYVECPLLAQPLGTNALGRLAWLMGRAEDLGIERVVLPMEAPSHFSPAEKLAQALAWRAPLEALLNNSPVQINLEINLPLQHLEKFVAGLAQNGLSFNYDTGNSAFFGLPPLEELAILSSRIGSVHLKDKQKGGGSYHLGQGDVDFQGVAEGLRLANFQGEFILEAPRGEPGDELATAQRDVAFARRIFEVE
jgi:L-ribulose-5-phosphate 3-epimerase